MAYTVAHRSSAANTLAIVAGMLMLLTGAGIFTVKCLFFSEETKTTISDGLTTVESIPDSTAWMWTAGTVFVIAGLVVCAFGLIWRRVRPCECIECMPRP